MDPAAMEKYIDYLDDLERSDPAAYRAMMEEMRSKLPSGDALSMESLQAAMGSPPASSPDGLRFPGNKVMQAQGLAEPQEGMYVDVTPGFVMKSTELTSKTKLFVNFCTSEHIKAFSKQKKLDENGEEQEGIHVPLSLGPPHEVLDHAKKTSLAIDVAVNPQVLADADADTSGTMRNFLCELAIQYIEEKYKFQVDPQYKLPKLSYRGDLPPPKHYIRKAQAPTIQEVDAPSKPAPTAPPVALLPLASTLWESAAPNEWRVCAQVAACDGGPALSPAVLADAPGYLQVRIDFPTRVTASDAIQVTARAEYVVVHARGFEELAVFLPYPVEAAASEARFAEANQALTITLPVDRTWHDQQLSPDPGSAPWLLSQALDDGEAAPTKEPSLEDKFQLGAHAQQRVQDDDELPEDRFHRKDMLSMHILEQRKADRAEKAQKAAEERAARKAENDAKVAAATAAGKTWREMYPTEPETTFVDLGEMLAKETVAPASPTRVESEVEVAKAAQGDWASATKLQLTSSLAFELLD
ncbi:hypothetical protein ACHHYP_05679 [Achlya hypogyna]|uniref:PIH1 domain-containing protein 1 n=1 Tax=Achlya hypogyna TaxID=1202772 RepID=A0A1V9YX37_ACHHY|nr:hypothetical protein ACHHYP_05679 [Achlya hypogyna]